jgi:peptidylprolyl isomerase
MKVVEDGDYVKVTYTGRLDNGEIFDANDSCCPLEVHMGAGDVIKGFEEALLGMSQFEKKTFTLSPEDAYGPRDDTLSQDVARSELPPDFQPEEGEVVVFQAQDGEQGLATVRRVGLEEVTFDLNHPLAGEALTFEIEVSEINDAPTQTECPSGCSCH